MGAAGQAPGSDRFHLATAKQSRALDIQLMARSFGIPPEARPAHQRGGERARYCRAHPHAVRRSALGYVHKAGNTTSGRCVYSSIDDISGSPLNLQIL